MPLSHTARPPYRPALDGLRAIAVIGVLLFHLNPSWLPGGWFGVDLFFVLSGFLITTLIIREQNRTGRINFPAFWLARMRRLIPALVTTLIAVVIVAWFVTAEARRQSLSYDVLAALGYVANWRFMLSDEGYFARFLMPSPLRHTWSLSIEEQFYLVFPLLMGLLGWISTRRLVHAIVLGVLALGSAVWMFLLFEPGADPVRVYFGTDTRAFELLIGAVGAIVFRRQAFQGFTKRKNLVSVLAWFGILLVVLGMLLLPENSAAPYQGGLVVLCLAALCAILAAASSTDSLFSRIFGWTPLRWIGLISYPLYLWHWPVIVFSEALELDIAPWAIYLAQATLSILLAWATYKFVEGPIRSRKQLIPRLPGFSRAAMLLAIPALVFSTLIFGQSSQVQSSTSKSDAAAVLVPIEVNASREYSAQVLGNSIPASLVASVPGGYHPGMALHSNTFIGCEPFDWYSMNNGEVTLPTPACNDWRQAWPSIVSDIKPDLLIYFVSQSLVNDVKINDTVVKFGTPEFDALIKEALSSIKTTALESGAGSFALSNLACHEMVSFGNNEIRRINDTKLVRRINSVVAEWAAAEDVFVVDSYSALCPNDQFSHTVNGVKLYSDGLHFTSESGPIFWSWMAPQLISQLESRG